MMLIQLLQSKVVSKSSSAMEQVYRLAAEARFAPPALRFVTAEHALRSLADARHRRFAARSAIRAGLPVALIERQHGGHFLAVVLSSTAIFFGQLSDSCRPVSQTDQRQSPIDLTQLFPTTFAIFRGRCLLNAC
jgi:hypothetical protein